MSTVNDPSNIVDLGSRQDPRNERVGHLLESVRQHCVKQLKELVDGMFERVDDSLFDLAEKAENNAVQTQYFDGMREVRKRRALAERQFLESVRRTFSDFSAGRHHQAPPATEPSAGASLSGELSLVDDSELEESLAITSMVAKTRTRLVRQLYALNQRLSVILGGNKVSDTDNPIGPTVLCDIFRQAMRELDVETRVRLIIYKLFDRYVLAGLGELYVSVNDSLAEAGVLPKLRHAIPGRQRRGTPAATGTGADAPPRDDSAEGDFQSDFYQMLNQLLASRQRAGGGGNEVSGGMPSLSPAELLGALGLLQNQTAVHVATHADVTGQGVDTHDINALKAHLVTQINQLRGSKGARMSGADEDTIDLVGMLFEFILEDRNLPVEMQVLLARLQIPYLKAAILDRRMFAHASHPARRLLDALAEAAKGWSEESDRGRRLYAKVHGIVETLLQEFDDDLDIFARLEQELADFQTTNRKRAELSEQRVAEATRGREKLQQARRRAAQEILARIDKQELPELVRGILTRAWANYLVLTLLRQGEDSQEFRVGLRFVDDFVWSTRPMTRDADRERLRQLLPLLEKSLRHGLATMAFQDSDVESLMTQLNVLYRRQLGTAAEAAPVATGQDDPGAAIPESMDVIATPEVAAGDADDTPAPGAADEEHMARVRQLKVGDWLEFSSPDEPSGQRAKLSWISPISGKYLFVNRRGLKVADKSAAQLADEFSRGAAIVLEELPLFDRALDAIVERLRRTQGQKSASAPPAADTPPDTAD